MAKKKNINPTKMDLEKVAGTPVSETHYKNTHKPIVTEAVLPRPAGLVAYAAFDFAGAHYEPGDAFDPEGLTPDHAFDELRGTALKNAAGEIGKAYTDRTGRRHVLPVKEA